MEFQKIINSMTRDVKKQQAMPRLAKKSFTEMTENVLNQQRNYKDSKKSIRELQRMSKNDK